MNPTPDLTSTWFRRLMLPGGTYRSGALQAIVRVQWFIRLRWLAIAVAGLCFIVDDLVDLVGHRSRYVLGVVVGLLLFNLWWQAWSRRIHRRVQAATEEDPDITHTVLLFANAQMAVDLLALTLLIRIFGGVISPLAIFYVFHVAIAALLLTPINGFLQVLWALCLYSVVVFGEYAGWIGDHWPLVDAALELRVVDSGGFVASVYVVVALALLGVWYLVSHVATTLDENERKLRRAMDALVTSHEAIDELQARRARFMLTAAHQLKSPLAGIQTLAGLIRDRVVTGDAVLGTTDKIVQRCEDAIEQVTELLTLARLKEEGAQRHATERTDVVAVARRLVGDFLSAARNRGVVVKLQVSGGEVPAVPVVERDLRDCLGNLIDNAIKYSPEGGRVRVDVAQVHDGVTVIVQDEGLGIAPDTQAVMFDEFRRGNQVLSRRIAGSGLGLSIVREVLEHVGGTITVCSTPGEGSTFRVWLPRAMEDSAEDHVFRSGVAILGSVKSVTTLQF